MSKESADSTKKTIDKEKIVKKRAARSIVAPRIDEEKYNVKSSSKETVFIPGTPKPVKEKPSKVVASPVSMSRTPVKKREARVIKAPSMMMMNEDAGPASSPRSTVVTTGGTGWPDRPPQPRVNRQHDDAKLSRELTSAVRSDRIKAEVREQVKAEVRERAQVKAETVKKAEPEVKAQEKTDIPKLNVPPVNAPTVKKPDLGTPPADAPVNTTVVSTAVPDKPVENVSTPGNKPRKLVKTVVTTTTTTYESVTDEELKEITGAVNGEPNISRSTTIIQEEPADNKTPMQAPAPKPVIRQPQPAAIPQPRVAPQPQVPQQTAPPSRAAQPQVAPPRVAQQQPQPIQSPQQAVQQPQPATIPVRQAQQAQRMQPQPVPIPQPQVVQPRVAPQPQVPQQPIQPLPQAVQQPESIIDMLPIPTTTAPAPNKPMTQMDRQLMEIEKALGISQDPVTGQPVQAAVPPAAVPVQANVAPLQGQQGGQAAPIQGGSPGNTPIMDEQTKKATEYLMLGVMGLVFIIVLCVLITLLQKIKKLDHDTGEPTSEFAAESEGDDSYEDDGSGTESFDVEQAGSEDEIPTDDLEMLDDIGGGDSMSDAPSGSVDVDNDNFTLRCTNVTVKLDTEGNPAALIFFTFTNKTSKQLSMSDVFPPSVTQNGEPCETYASLEEYPDEFYNKDMQISDGSTIDCCYSVSLKDAVSPIRLTIHDNYESFSDIGTTEIAIQ